MMFDLDWNGWTVSCIHSNEEGERMLWNILDSRVHSSEMGDPVLLDFWNVFDAKVNS